MRRSLAGRFGGGLFAVFERDFLVLTSAGRYVALRTLVVLALAAVAFAMLSSLGTWDARPRGQQATWGRDLFLAFAIAYPLLVALIGPALGAGSISGERATDTLSLVLAAPVRPFALVFAKFLSRLGALLVPLVGGLPIAAICFLYGGISPDLFVTWMGVVLAMAVVAVASSVLASAYAKSVAGAVTLAYFLGCVVPFLESWAVWALDHEARSAGWIWPDWIVEHTPIHALKIVFEGVGGTGTVKGAVGPFFVAATAGAALALVLAASRLSRESQAMAAGGPRRGRILRTLFANPVLDRATLGLPFRRGGVGAWATLCVIAALTWLPVTIGGWDSVTILVGMNLGTWAVILVILSRASQSLAVERQQGSLAVLRTTALTTGDVVDGKLLGLVLHGAALLLPAIVLAVLGATLASGGPDAARTGRPTHPEIAVGSAAGWISASGVLLLLFTAIGMRVSATATTAGRAAGVAFAISIGGLVAHGLLMFVLLLTTNGSGGDMLSPLAAASPPVILFSLSAIPNENPGSGEKQLLSWAIFWCVAWTLVAITLLRTTASAAARDAD